MRMTERWIVLGFGLQALGCGSEVVIIGGGQQADPCQPAQQSAQQQAQLRVNTRGTFIDGRLHVDATVDGERRYVVLEVGDGDVFILDAQEALVGPAQLVPIAKDTYARLHGPQQGVQIDLIDTRDPLAPQLAVSHALDGEVPAAYEGVYTAHDGYFYFCLRPETEGGSSLVALDLTDPFNPGEMTTPQTSACREFTYGTATAHGALWVSWRVGSSSGGSISSQLLDPTDIIGGISFGYSGGGIHQYGDAQAAATDGTRIVLDTENEDWMLVFEEANSPGDPYVAFTLPGPKQLLTVDAQIAYFATPDGVHAYDVADVQASQLLDDHAEMALTPKDTAFIAVDERHLVIAGADGRLVVIDRGESGPAQPATAYVGPRKDPTGAAPCD
jgi:hypothetical protein